MTTDEAQLVSAVSMLKALGVEAEADVEVVPRHLCRGLVRVIFLAAAME